MKLNFVSEDGQPPTLLRGTAGGTRLGVKRPHVAFCFCRHWPMRVNPQVLMHCHPHVYNGISNAPLNQKHISAQGEAKKWFNLADIFFKFIFLLDLSVVIRQGHDGQRV